MRSDNIPRLVETEVDPVAIAMAIYTIPQKAAERVDGLAVMPGLGETWRISDAIAAWERPTGRYLLVAGHNAKERYWEDLSLDKLAQAPYDLKRREGVVVSLEAEHTREQADWIVLQVQELKITSLALYVSPYHLMRAYCTVLKAFERLGVEHIPLVPVPVAVPPDALVPETGASAWDMLPGEVERLKAYQIKGDVVTRAELEAYLAWLWRTFLSV